MNSLLISALSIATVSTIATAFNALFQLKNNLSLSCTIAGHQELHEYMNELNLYYLLNVLQKYKCNYFNDTIKEINNELKEINKRIEYNKSLYIRCYPFIYRFHNNKKRLDMLMKKLKNEIEILKLEILINNK